MARIISSQELSELRLQHPDLAIVDVRLPDDFDAARLPGAVNQCVFEVAFLDELVKKGLHRDQRVCVYGAAPVSHEARVAAEKLERAGYTSVLELREGLEGWRSAGHPVAESGATPAAPRIADGSHELDPVESRIVWIGRNLVNKHWGHVALAGGRAHFQLGRFSRHLRDARHRASGPVVPQRSTTGYSLASLQLEKRLLFQTAVRRAIRPFTMRSNSTGS